MVLFCARLIWVTICWEVTFQRCFSSQGTWFSQTFRENQLQSINNDTTLKPDGNTSGLMLLHVAHTFTCPRVHFTFNEGHVYLDPSYYGYRFCVCDKGYYGTDGECRMSMSGATCKSPQVTDWADLHKSTMVIDSGYWPMPAPGNVSRLRQRSSPGACNPSGKCSAVSVTSYLRRNPMWRWQVDILCFPALLGGEHTNPVLGTFV